MTSTRKADVSRAWCLARADGPWPIPTGTLTRIQPPPRPMTDDDLSSRSSSAKLEKDLLADLQQLVRPRHARWDELALMAVRAYLLEQMRALGPVEQHHFGEGADAGVNLILRLPGQQPNLAPVLVAAHYDGPLGSPGADDNATGVAGGF